MSRRRAECRVAPEAERDLELIWLYSLETWGLNQANRYIDDLTAAFGRLAHNPKLGVACEHIRKGYRRNRVGRHMIYFRATDDGIAVIRVLHDRMDAWRRL